MLGEIELASGERRLGPGVVVGTLEQARGRFLGGATLLDAFGAASGLLVAESRSLLAKFGLVAGHVERTPATLSPGERTRAELALLSATGVNCLVLDEPTNHLDLPAIEQLEQALESFEGTLLVVTHDRGLLEALRFTRTVEIGDGRVVADHAVTRPAVHHGALPATATASTAVAIVWRHRRGSAAERHEPVDAELGERRRGLRSQPAPWCHGDLERAELGRALGLQRRGAQAGERLGRALGSHREAVPTLAARPRAGTRASCARRSRSGSVAAPGADTRRRPRSRRSDRGTRGARRTRGGASRRGTRR